MIGENIGIIVENELINGLEMTLECVIITFNNRFSELNVCCGPWLILMPCASSRALISTSDHNKRERILYYEAIFESSFFLIFL